MLAFASWRPGPVGGTLAGMRAALAHLRQADPALAELIARVGPCRLEVNRQAQPYDALVRAVAYQQIHGAAARAIFSRFCAAFPGPGTPAPAEVLAAGPEVFRAAGFSARKEITIRALAAAAVEGAIPSRRAAARLSDAALIERLVPIHGIGRWSVEMLLIFTLGRPDVLPVDDWGIREGYRLLRDLPEQPRPRALAEATAAWSPWRSVASWYLWRAVEFARKR